jgi:putative transposase
LALEGVLRCQCELYNAALEERRGAWRWERRSVSFFDQCKTLSGLKDVRPDMLACGVTVCRGTLRRLDLAFAAFYLRCRSGETPGFPRFKSSQRWDSVQWEDRSGWRVDEDRRRLRLLGIGDVKLNLHRPLRGTVKAVTVRREGRRWWVSGRCVDVPAQPLPAAGRSVGLDLGIVSLLTTSDGEHVENPRHGRRAAAKLGQAQQELTAKQRGSMHRRRAVARVAACHRKVRNQRLDHAHKLSRRLVDDYDLICHEDLHVTNLIRRAAPRANEAGGFDANGASAKTGLNRSIHDAGWELLLRMVAYKAESAGREVVAVHPRHTSQRCAQCGHVSADNRQTQAKFECRACGHQAHADVNAAVNILRAGRAQRSQTAQSRN